MAKQNEHPSGDARYKALDRVMKRAKYAKDSLLEVLNTAQETFGYLSEDLLYYVANQLKVPISQVYGVTTFYHLFTFEPLGEHNCVVCTGTACHVKGSEKIVTAISEKYGIENGETTEDGEFSLTSARCLGSCGLAPVIVLDGQILSKSTAESALGRVEKVLLQAAEKSKEAS